MLRFWPEHAISLPHRQGEEVEPLPNANPDLLVDSVRIVLVRDSPPERALKDREAGSRFHVWGLPRISFDGLARLIEPVDADTRWRTARLPYEVLIIGIYPEGR